MSILDSVKSTLTSAIEAVKISVAPPKNEAPAVINTEDKARTSGKATAGSTVVATLDDATETGNVSFASMTQIVHGTQAAEKPENDAGNEGGSMMGGGGLTSAWPMYAQMMRDQGASEEEIQAIIGKAQQQDQEMFSRMFANGGKMGGIFGNADAGKEGTAAPQGGGLTSQMQLYAQFMRDQGASEEEIQAMFDKVRQQEQEMFGRMFGNSGTGNENGGIMGSGMAQGGLTSQMQLYAQFMRDQGASEEEIQAMFDKVRQQDQEMFGRIFGNANAGKGNDNIDPIYAGKGNDNIDPINGGKGSDIIDPIYVGKGDDNVPSLNPPPGLEPWTPGGQNPKPGNPPVHPLPGTQLPPGLNPWTPGGQEPELKPGQAPIKLNPKDLHPVEKTPQIVIDLERARSSGPDYSHPLPDGAAY